MCTGRLSRACGWNDAAIALKGRHVRPDEADLRESALLFGFFPVPLV